MADTQAKRKLAYFSALELTVLLGLVPVLVMLVHGQVFRHGILLAGCIYTLCRLRGKVFWKFLFARPPKGWWRWPLARAVVVFVLAVAYVRWTSPALLFQLPLQRPGLWLLVIFLYPVLSVLPQEVIYRVWVFEAHAPLWVSPVLPVLASALFFGWVHIIYAGWFAVGACIAGGLCLALVYRARRGLPGVIWPLALEHSLYGLTMFTVGLGRYFFIAR